MINSIDPKTGVPLYQQIADVLRDSIAAGRILPGQKLPTVRDMAARMRVNPATVVAAYEILSREHIIVAKHGAGTFVAMTAARGRRLRQGSREKLEKILGTVIAAADAAGVSDAELHRLLTKARRREGHGYGDTYLSQKQRKEHVPVAIHRPDERREK